MKLRIRNGLGYSLLVAFLTIVLVPSSASAWQESEDSVYAHKVLSRFEARGLLRSQWDLGARELSRWELAFKIKELMLPQRSPFMTRSELQDIRELSRRFTPELQKLTLSQDSLKLPTVELDFSPKLKLEAFRIPALDLYTPNVSLEKYQLELEVNEAWDIRGGIERTELSPEIPFLGLDRNLNEDLSLEFDLRYAEPRSDLPSLEGWEVKTQFVVKF